MTDLDRILAGEVVCAEWGDPADRGSVAGIVRRVVAGGEVVAVEAGRQALCVEIAGCGHVAVGPSDVGLIARAAPPHPSLGPGAA